MAGRRSKGKKSRIFNKKNLVGILIVGIMVLSGIGYMWSDSTNSKQNYNGHKIISQNNKWYVQADDSYAQFDFHPTELENINMSADVAEYLSNVKMLYIVFDPDSSLIQDFEVERVRLEKDLPQFLKIYPVTGVTYNSTEYSNFPVVTCANATMYVPVLYFRKGNSTEIIANDTCIILQARDSYDVPAVTDRLMYGLLGVMQ